MLTTQLWIDLAGILVLQGGLLTFFNARGEIGRYLLFWLILERTAGTIVQARDHLEHYGMWGRTGGYQLTQLYSCRNLDTYPWVGWLMGGLDYHAVHHAFPDIPFVGVASPVENRLPVAFDSAEPTLRERIQAVLQRYGLPLMVRGQGYLHETLELSQQPSTIGASDPQNLRGHHYLLRV